VGLWIIAGVEFGLRREGMGAVTEATIQGFGYYGQRRSDFRRNWTQPRPRSAHSPVVRTTGAHALQRHGHDSPTAATAGGSSPQPFGGVTDELLKSTRTSLCPGKPNADS